MPLLSFIVISVAVAHPGGHHTYTADAQCTQSADLIKTLPSTEFKSLPFCMYSKNLEIPSSQGDKSIFYWLVESESKKETDPLVLWFNGGPSCSSLIGLFYELGPFYPKLSDNETVVLARNNFGWNRNANILFVDSPAGVGFSEAKTQESRKTGDDQTAKDALEFLQQFLNEHPEYNGRPVWLAGESYAGHYVPNLAAAIVNANKELGRRFLRRSKLVPTATNNINLKGFLVGNPATDDSWEFDGGSKYTALFNANYLSAPTYLHLEKACKGMNPFSRDSRDMSSECSLAMGKAGQESGNFNSYAIYADTCTKRDSGKRSLDPKAALSAQRGSTATQSPPMHNHANHAKGLADPCIEDFATEYLRRTDVVAAIHAPINAQWESCSSGAYAYTKSVLNKYRDFAKDDADDTVATANKLRILVYSGDVDSVVSTVGTRAWIDSLQLKESAAWRPWVDDEQLAGFTQSYQDGFLTFATVREAGHEVPQYQPERALAMFESFISNQALP